MDPNLLPATLFQTENKEKCGKCAAIQLLGPFDISRSTLDIFQRDVWNAEVMFLLLQPKNCRNLVPSFTTEADSWSQVWLGMCFPGQSATENLWGAELPWVFWWRQLMCRCVTTKWRLCFCCLNSRWLSFLAPFLFLFLSFRPLCFVQRKLQLKRQGSLSASSEKKKKTFTKTLFWDKKNLFYYLHWQQVWKSQSEEERTSWKCNKV